ncbi:type IV pilin protein [Bacillaceae bacterium W0354]
MNRKWNHGVTLLELLAVITVIGIITLIAVPIYHNYVEHAEEEVCHTNSNHLERMYELELAIDQKMHSDSLFRAFLLEHTINPCPTEGIITYENVLCSIHGSDSESDDNPNNEEEDDNGGVPYL